MTSLTNQPDSPQPVGGRVAIVTGGSRGIGLGIANRLAEEGCHLAICGLREESAVAETLAELRRFGGDVHYCRADIGETDDRRRFLEAVRERFGRLDVLVSNAGMAPRQRSDILEASEEEFARVLRVNLQGPYFLAQAAARWMIEQKQSDAAFHGCMIFISSVSAVAASLNRGEYCVSKAGLSMAARLWALRLAASEIPVYELRPGIVATDMTAGVREKYDKLIADGLVPQRRWGQPDDVGKAVAALVRGDLPYCTGEAITIDGGLLIPRL